MSNNHKGYRNDKFESEEYKAFKKAMASLNKRMTKGSEDENAIAPLGEMDKLDVKTISSGSIVLDQLAGGGFPVGRIIEIFGPEASGKTSIALNAIADVQRKGGNALFIDAEQALDPNYASVLGVDINKLGITQISIAELVFETCRTMIESETVDLIVVDTVASLMTQAEFDNPEKLTMAALARVMSTQLKILAPLANKHKCTIIFLNQIREKVGVMFGNPETTPGGRALDYYASQIIKVTRKGQYKEGTEILGTEVQFRIQKNKIAPPFQVGTTILTFAKGINRPAEIVEVGSVIGAIGLVGRTYSIRAEDVQLLTKKDREKHIVEEDGSIKLGTSKKAAIDTLEANDDLFAVAAKRVEEVMRQKRLGGEDPAGLSLEEADKMVPEQEEVDMFSN